ncbi:MULTISPECIES: DUF4340 domain-containing protein [unclassified Cobetia]|uniref:DUF4340 domain-containing protein n=1 Tax=unclassified Cobetia TaxID=2609414 RepID=UPI00159E9559|nr:MULTISPECIES: DUF4340 domain-containing protein [unclassified Cobetia]MCO7232354.1 DUF4340 domain-containing protein [Cobetia sp. Dlab-2-AX]MCO7235269.1 DUF4340 domain-containing protein [Cobetia sp. Dlab-2-U]NVN55161.1 DUF4340 domain-containing protein [bacterium Scap17]
MGRFNRAGWALTALVSVAAATALTAGPSLLESLRSGAATGGADPAQWQSDSLMTVAAGQSGVLQPLPLLSQVAASAQRIGIRRGAEASQDWLSLARGPAGDWQITSLAGWPVRQGKVEALVSQLGEAQLRTRKPATDEALEALGFSAQSPLLSVKGNGAQVSLQLGARPAAATQVNGAGNAELAGRYVRWVPSPSDVKVKGSSTMNGADGAPVWELTRDVGLPDWRGGMAPSEVLDVTELRSDAAVYKPLSRLDISLAASALSSSVRGASARQAPLVRGLAPDSDAAHEILAALSPLTQNDLRPRASTPESGAAQPDGWQPAVTLTLNWSRPSLHYRQHEQLSDRTQLVLAIAAGSKPWARLTLSGKGWPPELVARVNAVEIQVNGALRNHLLALGARALQDEPIELTAVAIQAALAVSRALALPEPEAAEPSTETAAALVPAAMEEE